VSLLLWARVTGGLFHHNQSYKQDEILGVKRMSQDQIVSSFFEMKSMQR
jgi:hypothetical protein